MNLFLKLRMSDLKHHCWYWKSFQQSLQFSLISKNFLWKIKSFFIFPLKHIYRSSYRLVNFYRSNWLPVILNYFRSKLLKTFLILFKDDVKVICCSNIVICVTLNISHMIKSFAKQSSCWLLMKFKHIVFKVFNLL